MCPLPIPPHPNPTSLGLPRNWPCLASPQDYTCSSPSRFQLLIYCSKISRIPEQAENKLQGQKCEIRGGRQSMYSFFPLSHWACSCQISLGDETKETSSRLIGSHLHAPILEAAHSNRLPSSKQVVSALLARDAWMPENGHLLLRCWGNCLPWILHSYSFTSI